MTCFQNNTDTLVSVICNSETEGDIWEKIIIPILVAILGPICVAIKVLYDRWDFKKKESVILRNKL